MTVGGSETLSCGVRASASYTHVPLFVEFSGIEAFRSCRTSSQCTSLVGPILDQENDRA